MISCKKQQSVLPQSSICPMQSSELSDTTISGVCTIYQKERSLKGKITVAIRSSVTKIIMMDELGVPLIVTSDSADACNLIRRFPPLTDKDAFLTGLAITAAIRRKNSLNRDNSSCQYIEDLKDQNSVVYYYNKVNEKDLTKIVHNNDFYYIHHNENNEGELINSKNEKMAQFKLY